MSPTIHSLMYPYQCSHGSGTAAQHVVLPGARHCRPRDEDNGGDALLAHSYSSSAGAWSAPVRCHPAPALPCLGCAPPPSRISLTKIPIGVNSRGWIPHRFCASPKMRLSFLNLQEMGTTAACSSSRLSNRSTALRQWLATV